MSYIYDNKLKGPTIAPCSGPIERSEKDLVLFNQLTIPDLSHTGVLNTSITEKSVMVVNSEGRLTNEFRGLISNTVSKLERVDEEELLDQFRADQDSRWTSHITRVSSSPPSFQDTPFVNSPTSTTPTLSPEKGKRPYSSQTLMDCILDRKLGGEGEWEVSQEISAIIDHQPTNNQSQP